MRDDLFTMGIDNQDVQGLARRRLDVTRAFGMDNHNQLALGGAQARGG